LSDGIWREGAAAYPKAWSDTPVSAALRLTYRNIADIAAVQFVTLWYRSLSGALPIALPESVTAGIDEPLLVERILHPPGLSWRLSAEPTVTSVFPRVSTVAVELVAEAETTTLPPSLPPMDPNPSWGLNRHRLGVNPLILSPSMPSITIERGPG